jgi:hypothetical protein
MTLSIAACGSLNVDHGQCVANCNAPTNVAANVSCSSDYFVDGLSTDGQTTFSVTCTAGGKWDIQHVCASETLCLFKGQCHQ